MEIYVILLEGTYFEDRMVRKNYFTTIEAARAFIEKEWPGGKWGFANIVYYYNCNNTEYTFNIERLYAA